MDPKVSKYLKDIKTWKEETTKLRSIILEAGVLDESLKWGKPCYSFEGNNIAIIQPFKACLGMMFFKGTLLKDSKAVLIENGANSQAGRRFEFTSVQEIAKMKATIKSILKRRLRLRNQA